MSTRRDFLRQSTLLGATLATTQLFGQTGFSTPARKVRVAIVGGRFGLGFQFHEHPDCIVEAVADLRPERLAALQKVYKCAKGYPSLEEMLKDPKVEAVFLATPAPDHVRHTLLCLAAGKHVLSAVPAAMTLEECGQLAGGVKKSGLTYMMGETSCWQQLTISARKFHAEGRFGHLYYTESEYHHPGLETLYFENGKRTWRHGLPPMHYPTHCTAHLLTETALFRTDRGNSMRVAIWWRGAQKGGERARYFGDKMSFYFSDPTGTTGPSIVRAETKTEKDSGGFERSSQILEKYAEVKWWKTDMLPEPLRHDSGHEGSHCFITHEFVDAIAKGRKPFVGLEEALAYTVPGMIAHQSALNGGQSLKIPTITG
jgi:predicted dehydrogenase